MFFSKPRHFLTLLLIAVLAFSFILPGYASPLEQKIKETQQKLGRVEQNLKIGDKSLPSTGVKKKTWRQTWLTWKAVYRPCSRS